MGIGTWNAKTRQYDEEPFLHIGTATSGRYPKGSGKEPRSGSPKPAPGNGYPRENAEIGSIRDLAKRSEAEREEHVKALAELSLKELRDRQDLVDKQKERAFNEYATAKQNGQDTTRLERAGSNLDEMRKDLDEAVDRRAKSNPKEVPKRGFR